MRTALWNMEAYSVKRLTGKRKRRYSKLFTIPDDAKDDWKAAVEECKRMLEKDGVDWQSAK